MRTFLVIAEIPNEDRTLSPGLFAEVELLPSKAAAPGPGEAGAEGSEAGISSRHAASGSGSKSKGPSEASP